MNFLALLLITPVVVFYLLVDWHPMLERVDGTLPRDHAPTIRRLGGEINDAVSAFIRGQGAICMMLGIYYAVGLSWAGIDYGLLVGLSTGLLAFIPIVGWLLGLIFASGLAIVQFWPDLTPLAKVVGVLVAGMAFDAAVLSPRFVGHKVGLHPVWLIFALFVFSYLFGFVGTLVAVPLAAAVGVLVRFAVQVYLDSSVYKGTNGASRALRQGAGMSGPSRQLLLDLAQRPALGAEDFLVSASNQAAADMIDRWPDWPHASIVVVAPAHAGKTHLANVWRLKSARGPPQAGALREEDVASAKGALLVEDLHAGIANERVLFHLLNLVREHQLSMLLTSRVPPGELEVRLPDLRSRLRALPLVTIARPDEGAAEGRSRSSISATGSSSWSRTSSVISRCIWSNPWRRPPISWPRSTGWRWPRTAR